jgi:hypothetical protein
MRVLLVSLALLSVPFVVAMGQDPSQSQRCKHTTFTPHDAQDSGGHSQDPDAQDRRCTPPPPPAPACGPTGSLGGSASVSGEVINATTNAGIAGWCVQVFKNGTALLGATTDASGNYTLAGIVGDTTTYLVCEVQQSGWSQTFPAGVPLPSCSSGALGYSFQLNTGNAASVDFLRGAVRLER